MEQSMLQTVQLSIGDGRYSAAVREAVAHSCAWRIESVERPDLSRNSVLVVDEASFERLPLPLPNPERIVLISRKEPELLAEAWDAGIVSVVSEGDSINTVLLAIMAAALRVAQIHTVPVASGISPSVGSKGESLAPYPPSSSPSEHCKLH
jgi:hypothetical protein